MVKSDTKCWIWQTKGAKKGYPRTSFEGVHGVRVHHAAYEIFVGPRNKNLVIRHTCDNTFCCNPEHLIQGTQADNIKDMVDRGRYGTPPWTGGKLPRVIAEKISVANKGRIISPETRRKISEAKTGKPGGTLGFKHRVETRKLLSELAKLRVQSEETKAKRRATWAAKRT